MIVDIQPIIHFVISNKHKQSNVQVSDSTDYLFLTDILNNAAMRMINCTFQKALNV